MVTETSKLFKRSHDKRLVLECFRSTLGSTFVFSMKVKSYERYRLSVLQRALVAFLFSSYKKLAF